MHQCANTVPVEPFAIHESRYASTTGYTFFRAAARTYAKGHVLIIALERLGDERMHAYISITRQMNAATSMRAAPRGSAQLLDTSSSRPSSTHLPTTKLLRDRKQKFCLLSIEIQHRQSRQHTGPPAVSASTNNAEQRHYHRSNRNYSALFALTSPSFSNHWRINLFTSSGFCVSAQCVAGTSPRVSLGIRASMALDISGFSTES